eukprot:CFRG1328T1
MLRNGFLYGDLSNHGYPYSLQPCYISVALNVSTSLRPLASMDTVFTASTAIPQIIYILLAGCDTSISLKIALPSLVRTIPPIGSSNPCRPKPKLTVESLRKDRSDRKKETRKNQRAKEQLEKRLQDRVTPQEQDPDVMTDSSILDYETAMALSDMPEEQLSEFLRKGRKIEAVKKKLQKLQKLQKMNKKSKKLVTEYMEGRKKKKQPSTLQDEDSKTNLSACVQEKPLCRSARHMSGAGELCSFNSTFASIYSLNKHCLMFSIHSQKLV